MLVNWCYYFSIHRLTDLDGIKNDFVSRGRSVSDLKADLVLTTKYRKNLFTKKMLDRLHEVFEDLLEKWECRVIEFNGEENHVHLVF